jgi:unsaturated rhamnogalacturonyl hydrolase
VTAPKRIQTNSNLPDPDPRPSFPIPIPLPTPVKNILLTSITAGLFSLVASPVFAQATTNLTSAASPLEWSERMAASQIVRSGSNLNPPPTGKGSWDYTTGLFCDALIRLTYTTGDQKYEKTAEGIIGSFIGPDGTIATYEKKRAPRPLPPGATPTPNMGIPDVKINYSLDEVESGVPVLELYDITKDDRYKKAAAILRNQLKIHPRIPEGGFFHKSIYPMQMWLDGLYMGEPFYAGYATRFNEPEDFTDIVKQFTLIGDHTYDPKTGLFYHGWDEDKKLSWANPQTGASPNFWGRAIGWYAMAMVDVLDSLPKNDPGRPAMLDLVQKMAGGILKNQDPKSGVWWQIVDQPGREHNYQEASASSMFTYFLAKAINNGYLPTSDIPDAKNAYQGLLHEFISASPDGQSLSLNNICRVAGLDTRRNGSYEYYTQVEPIVSNDLKGVGPFIMAGLECNKLFGNEKLAP